LGVFIRHALEKIAVFVLRQPFEGFDDFTHRVHTKKLAETFAMRRAKAPGEGKM
jgi:hypothetical protein